MSNDIIPFDFSGIEVRTVAIDGEPWFVAADVARALGYSATAAMTRSMDDDDKGVRTLHTPSGHQDMTIISESGLYSAILRSTIPSARAFKRWVTHEVIPAIRKTGQYAVPATELDQIKALHAAVGTLLEQNEKVTTRAVMAEAFVAELEPAAWEAETYRAAEGQRAIGDVANDFKALAASRFPGMKVQHTDVWAHAHRLGLVIRGGVRHNQPTAQAIEAGWALTSRVTFDTKTRGAQTKTYARLTPRGEARLRDGLTTWAMTHSSLEIKEPSNV